MMTKQLPPKSCEARWYELLAKGQYWGLSSDDSKAWYLYKAEPKTRVNGNIPERLYFSFSNKNHILMKTAFTAFENTLGISSSNEETPLVDGVDDESSGLSLRERIWHFHLQKKFGNKNSLYRSSLFYIFSNNLDLNDTSKIPELHSDTARCIELYDMITYIMNDVMDGKNGYKPEYEEEYRKLTQDLWNQIDQTLACHGKTGEKLSTCFQKNYQALDSYWIRQSKGRVPKVWEISDPTQLQELYEERLTCYDTLRIVGECAEIITTDEIKESNQRSALITAIREFNSLSQHIQKLNDAADLNTDIKRNAGADWRNGEITKLTMGFHGFHHNTKEYLTYRDETGITRLEDDIKDGNIQKIDRLMCREGAYQAVLDDIAETRRKSVKVMHRMRSINYQHPTDDWHKALSPMQQSFLFKKLEIYFENNILEALETKIAAFNNKKNSQETSRGM